MQRFDHRFTAMGGPCRLRLDCSSESVAMAAIGAVEAEVRRLERKYSRYLADSLTSTVNRGAGGGAATAIDAETAGLLSYADTLWRESGGMFDLTSGVLRRAWNFKSLSLPVAAEIQPLLALVGWDRVEWGEGSVYLPDPGMELDFGGCVKEYGADSASAVLVRQGIAHGLVDLAGDMAAVGGQADGQPWQVGIRDPAGGQQPLAVVGLTGAGLASSGDYERKLDINGQRYGHILSPLSGWPVQGLVAVSVTASQCLVAGSSATLALLQPAAEGLAWLRALGLPWLAIDREGCLHGSSKPVAGEDLRQR